MDAGMSVTIDWEQVATDLAPIEASPIER